MLGGYLTCCCALAGTPECRACYARKMAGRPECQWLGFPPPVPAPVHIHITIHPQSTDGEVTVTSGGTSGA